MKHIIFSLLFIIPGLTYAQQAPAPKAFVGVQVAAQRYQVRYPATGGNEIGIVPWMAFAGYKFTPRLAAQLGVSYRKTSQNVVPVQGSSSERETYSHLALPITLRWTLTQNLERRFSLDAVGGVALLFSRHKYPLFVESPTPNVMAMTEKLTQPYLTFGVGAKYRLGRRIEATGDLLLNKTTRTGGRLSPSFYTLGLGIRYGL
ncbi:hypothetical protein HNQ93_000047 [Hymenobacter luteus]|uniref:Outer membrane protein beta-barrel domain-containing protein n=2 Tax=Hymenobacter TaxID=89966 RepID=A0A7W9WB17_9BACT|nr:hypothetical protein [Hymenobacter latericoloratus]MBB6057217.1 hypothetical protein [Hymenobacter luteus]